MRKPCSLIAVLALIAAVAAVPVADAKTKKKTKKTPTLAVAVKDNFFSPKKKTIKKGTKVTWTWKGAEDHNVTLVTAPKGIKKPSYTSKTQGTGKAFTRTLKTAGKYFFVCTLHAGMEQTITVSK